MQGMKAKAPKHLTFGQLWGRGWVAFFSIGPLAWGGLVWFPRLVAWLVADAASPAWKAVDFVLRLAILLVVLPWLLGVGVELSYPQLLESLLGRPEVGETPREDTGGEGSDPSVSWPRGGMGANPGREGENSGGP